MMIVFTCHEVITSKKNWDFRTWEAKIKDLGFGRSNELTTQKAQEVVKTMRKKYRKESDHTLYKKFYKAACKEINKPGL